MGCVGWWSWWSWGGGGCGRGASERASYCSCRRSAASRALAKDPSRRRSSSCSIAKGQPGEVGGPPGHSRVAARRPGVAAWTVGLQPGDTVLQPGFEAPLLLLVLPGGYGLLGAGEGVVHAPPRHAARPAPLDAAVGAGDMHTALGALRAHVARGAGARVLPQVLHVGRRVERLLPLAPLLARGGPVWRVGAARTVVGAALAEDLGRRRIAHESDRARAARAGAPACTGLQPLARRVAASHAWGCSLSHVGLQPLTHGVAASVARGVAASGMKGTSTAACCPRQRSVA